MAQEVPEARTGSSTSSVSTASIRVSHRQAQMHAPFPSWSPYPAGMFVDPAALAAQPWAVAAAAESRMPSQRALGDAWTQSVPYGTGGAHGFLSLVEARNVTSEMFEDVPTADDYYLAAVTGLGNASYGLASVDGRNTAASSASPIKPEIAASALGTCLEDSMGCVPCHGHDWQRELGGAPMAPPFLQKIIPGSVEKQNVSERPMESYAVRTLPAGSASFSGHRSTQEFMSSNGKQQDVPPQEVAGGGSGSGAGSVTTRRRKSEDRAGGNTKKSRKEASKTSSPPPKMIQPQEPKVDLGEKIAALQQIVSPFGKTDRASVLSETIKYINFLHDQIQLFSEPYMTKSLYKGRIQSGGEEEKTGTAHELRSRLSRGLCLVPVPWASQVCRDDTLPDCCTPAYRSCLNQ
ncbi:hypothetical protein QOZ80_4AG0307230 [Eleusine coracana subsp. coracana]|nr:hypothetical protein QOZ80_4AG0307230 [Eleusine coracana subsp. coracana]